MLSIEKEVLRAAELGRQVAAEKGLTVLEGETPTDHQVGIASLHAREDTAALFAMCVAIMKRQDRLQRWVYGLAAALLIVLANLH